MNTLKEKLARISHRTQRHIRFWTSVLYYLLKEPATPWLSRTLAGITLAYLLSPIDLIPDFIPVLGQLDDMVIVPLLLFLTIQSIPRHIRETCIAKARRTPIRPARNPMAAVVILFLWLAVIVLILKALSTLLVSAR